MATENEPENSTRGQQPAVQNGAVQRLVQQPNPTELSMTLFPKFPAEIQQKIFLEAVNKPAVHFLRADRKFNGHQWYLHFSPITKGLDKSGYRIVEKIKLAGPAAAAAMRVFKEVLRRESQARLPFKQLDIPIDGANDLVHLQLYNKKWIQGFFHPDLSFLSVHSFDDTGLVTAFSTVQKVALSWRDRDDRCSSWKASFRCPEDAGIHAIHSSNWWKMCPEEVCGLLNCFPKLREFYLILEPSRSNLSKGFQEVYIKNYNTLPATSPLRRSLSRFTAAGCTYIELHPALCKRLSRDRSRLDSFQMCHVSSMDTFLFQLKHRYFLRDDDPALPPHDREQQAAMYRLSLEERKNLVFNILVGISDETTQVWERGDREAVRGFLEGV